MTTGVGTLKEPWHGTRSRESKQTTRANSQGWDHENRSKLQNPWLTSERPRQLAGSKGRRGKGGGRFGGCPWREGSLWVELGGIHWLYNRYQYVIIGREEAGENNGIATRLGVRGLRISTKSLQRKSENLKNGNNRREVPCVKQTRVTAWQQAGSH